MKTVEEILLEAIQSELDTRRLYKDMASLAPDAETRDVLTALADRELIHRAQLERRYKELFDKPPPPMEESSMTIPPGVQKFDPIRALKFAMEHERNSEAQYRFLSERATEKEIRNIANEMAEIEWKHRREIETELQERIGPDQFLFEI